MKKVIPFLAAVLFLLLMLADCNTPKIQTQQTIIKMKESGGTFTLPCKVNGLEMEFILDTGASDVSISLTEALFMLRHGYLNENNFVGVEKYSLADGSVSEGDSVILRDMEIGGLKLSNVRASIVRELEAPLLLGQSALRKLGNIEINYANNMLIIKTGSAPAFGSGQPFEHADFTEAQYGIEMVFIKGGTFTMGCTTEQGNDCRDEEKPIHQVALSDFYIGRHELTQAQWKAVMGANNNPSRFRGDDLPVENVSWDDTQFFIERLNEKTGKIYRLPSEAEWEYASRGGNQSLGYKYSGGDDIDDVTWHKDNSGNTTHPAGTKKANELGIYDMSGNVNEWVNDCEGKYDNTPQTNPTGPYMCSRRMIRSGSWNVIAWFARVSFRLSAPPGERSHSLGFRIAHSSE